MISTTKMILTAVLSIGFFLTIDFVELAEARSRGGGRSFSSSPSRSKQPPKQSQPATAQPTAPRPGGGFGSGLAGGIMGGFLGSMLFGGVAHAGGGLGGSGIGLFEILLFAGIGFFLFRWFARRRALATGYGSAEGSQGSRQFFSGVGSSAPAQEIGRAHV